MSGGSCDADWWNRFAHTQFAFAVLFADAVWTVLKALQAQSLTGRCGDLIGVLTEQKS